MTEKSDGQEMNERMVGGEEMKNREINEAQMITNSWIKKRGEKMAEKKRAKRHMA